MRSVAAILLLSIFLSGEAFNHFVVYMQYKMNSDRIAATLCENRNKPQMHCNGKCYLKKQLKKADDNSKQHDASLPVQKSLLYIMPQTDSICISDPAETVSYSFLAEKYPEGFLRIPEHPPAV